MKMSQQGLSIVEALVSMVVLTLVALLGYSTVAGLQTQLSDTQSRLNTRSNVAAMIESLAENTGSYVRVFRRLEDAQRENYLAYANAKIHYDNRGIYDQSECPQCEGRISYLIEPHPTIPAFSSVSIRVYVSQDDWTSYRFITGNL